MDTEENQKYQKYMHNSIFKRTSIRHYTEEEVSDEQLNVLLKAAMAAPSANNLQPWEFVIIKDRHTLDKIRYFHLYSAMLKEAPVAILVCGDEIKKTDDGHEFWQQDCSAATENLLIEATELGLGGVWLGVYPNETYVKKLQNLLELPKNIIPFSIVSIGYPAADHHPKNKYDELKIHYEKW